MISELINGGLAEGVVALIIAIAGGIFIAGQVKANAARNQQDIDDIKDMMSSHWNDMKEMISKNMSDMRALIDTNKECQKDTLSREIQHLRDLVNLSNMETREDIKRLELKLQEASHSRERLALVEQSLRSLHKRLDLEPPLRLDGNE